MGVGWTETVRGEREGWRERDDAGGGGGGKGGRRREEGHNTSYKTVNQKLYIGVIKYIFKA